VESWWRVGGELVESKWIKIGELVESRWINSYFSLTGNYE
jgi:hypothetical protein